MTILGIESSCDETAVAVVTRGDHVAASVIASQVPVHAQFGGVVPELASRNHLLAILPLLERAVGEAGLADPRDVDAIAVTAGPGLVGALLVGLQTAKTLAWAWRKPLVAVDHVLAHLFAVHLVHPQHAPATRPRPTSPYLALAVSGGHTSLYRVDGFARGDAPRPHPGNATVIAHTLDDAAGEAFDKAAKLLGLPYPGGVSIERAARGRDATRFSFPRPLPERARRAFSFSGLKTALRLFVSALPAPLTEEDVGDLAAAFQAAVVEHLWRKTAQAAEDLGLSSIVLSGGVAANTCLRETFETNAAARGFRVYPTPLVYCTDNAAMVAGLGGRLFACGEFLTAAPARTLDAYANQSFRQALRHA